MNEAPNRTPDDATLVAWLDGEASETERNDVECAIATDGRVQSKVELLRAVRRELGEALAHADGFADPPRRREHWPWIAAAAALAVVVSVAVLPGRSSDVATSANDLLEVRVSPVPRPQPLFSNIRFELVGRAKTATACRVVARQPDETDEAAVARLFPGPEQHPFVPVVLDAEIELPNHEVRRGAVARVEATFGEARSALDVDLIDCVFPHPAISPMVAMRPMDRRPADDSEQRAAADFVWSLARTGSPDVGGRHGFVPEESGAYLIRFSLRAIAPTGDARFAAFGEPVVVETRFSVTGVTGSWSEPVDGLAARAIAAAQHFEPDQPLAIALQLRNDSERPRSYNVAGVTLAKVPQPFHFELIVDGERWTQRDRLPVILSSGGSFLPQPEATTRSVIVLADYWHHDGKMLSDLAGRHTIVLRFHFEPTLWGGDPRDLWRGTIETPPITIEVTGR